MRKIKFRGWYDGDKEITAGFVYGCLAIDSKELGTILSKHQGVRVKLNTVNEFTGCFDENNKEIYENDIILWHNKIYRVNYVDSSFVMNSTDSPINFLISSAVVKVIGNRTENPLLFES